MRFNHQALKLLAPLLGMLFLSGCASMMDSKSKSTKESEKKSWFKKKEYQLPQSMNVTWAHDIISVPGKPPARGFGGRIYFYNEKSQAIPVDGELMVYGFDDTSSIQPGAALLAQGMDHADKRYRFTDEQFTTHFSESDLGASYSIWIPWDAAPGPKKKIMLIPTFKSKDGKVIRGNAATLLLPGWSDEPQGNPVIQASANMPADANAMALGMSGQQAIADSGDARPKTTTIQMPIRSASRVQPLLTPEQANELIEKARRGEIPSASSMVPGASMIPEQPTASQQSTASQQPIALGPAVNHQAAGAIDFGRSIQSGSQPLFHIPTTSLTPSLLQSQQSAQPGLQPATQTGMQPASMPSGVADPRSLNSKQNAAGQVSVAGQLSMPGQAINSAMPQQAPLQ